MLLSIFTIIFHSLSIFLIGIRISVLYNKNDSWEVKGKTPGNQVVGENNKVQLADFG